MAAETKKIGTSVLLWNQENKLLMGYSIKRQAWELPGGKLEKDETIIQCAIREVKEETGYEIHEYDPESEKIEECALQFSDYMEIADSGYLVMIFDGFVDATKCKPISENPEPHKYEKWEWISIRQLQTLPVAEYSKRVLKMFYSVDPDTGLQRAVDDDQVYVAESV